MASVVPTDFGILGTLQLIQDGRVVDLGSPRQQALLARLLVARAVVSADRLIEDLWATDTPESARHALHVYVSRLRGVLAAESDRLERHGGGYRLRVESGELDATRFEQAVKDGRATRMQDEPEAASERLAEALRFWRGPVLAEFADEAWARDEVARLEELRLTALEDRVWADLELGRTVELVEELEGLVSEHPFREAYAEQLMLALYRSGRQADALRAYQAQRARLSEELGIDPGPALQRMQERILAQDRSLDGEESPAPASPSGLPLQRTSFVGREQEAIDVARLLVRCRLLTLTGPPGTGKTRLGLHLADRAGGFPDGKFFVPLAPLNDPVVVAGAIARALGLHETRDEPVVDTTKAYLSTRRVLLLLDNFEHLLDAATLVGELLDAAPDLKVIATSRSPLRISGEQEYSVPPLEVPPAGTPADAEQLRGYDAPALFVARAMATDPGFEVGPVDAGVIAAITRRLDGLPLAVELAAARVRLFAPSDLLERLEHRRVVLGAGPTDVEERHRTMRAAVSWSHDLLEQEEQALFRHLGVFRGGFSLAAATAVGGCSEDDVEAGVESLLAQSLLYRPVSVGQARYAMLETMRAFALEQLATAGDEADATERHACFYRDLALAAEPELSGEDPGSAAERLGTEVDNLRAALEHAEATAAADAGLELAAAIWRFWQSTGQLREGRSWLDRMLILENGSSAARAKGLEARAGLSYWLGDFEAARPDYLEAHDLLLASGDRLGAAEALYGLSLVASFLEEAEEAERLAHAARQVFEEEGSEAQVGQALLAAAAAAWKQGELERARQSWEEGLEIHRRLKDQALIASLLVGLGGISFQLGLHEEAVSDIAQGLDLAVEIGNAHTQVFALDGVASFTATAHPLEAATLGGAVHSLRESHGGGWNLGSFGVEDAKMVAGGLLPAADVEAAWSAGNAMSLEQAVALGRRLLA